MEQNSFESEPLLLIYRNEFEELKKIKNINCDKILNTIKKQIKDSYNCKPKDVGIAKLLKTQQHNLKTAARIFKEVNEKLLLKKSLLNKLIQK